MKKSSFSNSFEYEMRKKMRKKIFKLKVITFGLRDQRGTKFKLQLMISLFKQIFSIEKEDLMINHRTYKLNRLEC